MPALGKGTPTQSHPGWDPALCPAVPGGACRRRVTPLPPASPALWAGEPAWSAASFSLTVSLRCSGRRSFSWAMHSLIRSRLFFSMSRCGSL